MGFGIQFMSDTKICSGVLSEVEIIQKSGSKNKKLVESNKRCIKQERIIFMYLNFWN